MIIYLFQCTRLCYRGQDHHYLNEIDYIMMLCERKLLLSKRGMRDQVHTIHIRNCR